MPDNQQFVTKADLASDFFFDDFTDKIHNNSVVLGSGSPGSDPPYVDKEWIYVDLDSAEMWFWSSNDQLWTQIVGGGGGSDLNSPRQVVIVADNSDTAIDGTVTELLAGGPEGGPLFNTFLILPTETTRGALDLGSAEDWPTGTRVALIPLPSSGVLVARGVSVVQHVKVPAYYSDFVLDPALSELEYPTPITVTWDVNGVNVPRIVSGTYGDIGELMGDLLPPGITGDFDGGTIPQLPDSDPNNTYAAALITVFTGSGASLDVISVAPGGTELDGLVGFVATPGSDDWLIGPSLTVQGTGNLGSDGISNEHHSTDSNLNTFDHQARFEVADPGGGADKVWLWGAREQRTGNIPYAPLTAGDWPGSPAMISAALDQLAARLNVLEP